MPQNVVLISNGASNIRDSRLSKSIQHYQADRLACRHHLGG